ncbi:MAG: hypothetical protein IH880_04275 [Candidatus Marinimicrobia bacterium]|nr:hypothetical protein [Candidatus Neomarinimicrobiota bacterium]
MKINPIAAQYLKLSSNAISLYKPDQTSESPESPEENQAEKNSPLHPKSASSDPTSSNSILRELLSADEQSSIKKLFGSDALLKVNSLIDNNEEKISDLPRGMLVNIKI